MKKKIPLNIVVTVVLIAMTVTFSMTMVVAMKLFDTTVNNTNQKAAMYDKIAEIDALVRANFYGEIPDVLTDRLSAGYISGLLNADSRYYTAQQFSDLLNRQSGKVMGVGVDIIKDATSGYARVTKVYEESPAAEAEMEKGWYIVTIGGQDVKSLSVDAITSLLQGEVGTQVELGLVVGAEERNLTLVRKAFEISGIEFSLEEEVGYIKISTFNDSTPAQFDYAMQQLLNSGATSLVLDLRGNTSTNLESAARILDVICPAGTLLSAQYMDGTTRVLYTSSASEVNTPIVCLTNANTASAAEVFCQVLKDYGKARTVGNATAGKGSILTTYRLSDGSAILIPTAAVLTPTTGKISVTGLAPDYDASLTAQQEQNFYDLSKSDDSQFIRGLEIAQDLAGVDKAAQEIAQSQSSSESSGQSDSDNSGQSDSASDSSGDDDASSTQD